MEKSREKKASSTTIFSLLAKGICQECRLTGLIEHMLFYVRALMKRMQYTLRVEQPSFQLHSSLHLPQTPPPLLPVSKSPPQWESHMYQNSTYNFREHNGPLQTSPIMQEPQFNKRLYCLHYFSHWENLKRSCNHQESEDAITDLCLP